ncbi:MAG: sulfatase-like hydrolase/transferase [Kiritimatiellae bacterium]|nr:sulfatase-like hydrolase/transferase [Kiritimatiellia bacterium]
MGKSDRQPNVLFIMPDQMRGDCLSLARHPVVLTPNIDEIGAGGVFFRRAYTSSASCIPARRALLTGQFPGTNGMVGYGEGVPITAPTLPQALRDAGYETVICGRYMHQSPYEEGYGYNRRILGSVYIEHDDYAKEIEREAPGGLKMHGISWNGWTARPWFLPEHLHPTTWVIRKARAVLAGHDGDAPLFLTTSFYAPHPPLVPPAFYMERYLRMELPPAAIGDWAVPPPNDGLGAGVDAHRVLLAGEALRSAQAGYFGLINHIDDQLFWLIRDFLVLSRRQKRPWLIVFTSDHGELLGDHYYFRKCEPYEGASSIPFLIRGSGDLGIQAGQTCMRPVCLEDLMPTLLELAGVACPAGVEGQSLVPVLRGEDAEVRPWLHGEHAPCYGADQAYHFLADGRMKYIWRPHDGSEQLFDLAQDPQELHDLADGGGNADLAVWRARLMERLANRPEGFTDGRRLIPGRPYGAVSCPR